ncbi:NB-ARC domain-containing protein [Nostoc sp.]|uniref:NB-ARC domain-containing protein n=1 Tax=Nostoc sp. TaxID=1180 RepID=UPI002FF7DA9A
MTVDEALAILDTLFQHKSLNSAKEQVFREIWEGRTYEEMADILKYEVNYIKHIGSELLLSLSQALNTKVTKSNCHTVMRRLSRSISMEESHSTTVNTLTKDNLNIEITKLNVQPLKLVNAPKLVYSQREFTNQKQDWVSAVKDISIFYGRQKELDFLKQWIIKDHCHLVVMSGMGGVGKTTLSIKLVQQIQTEFDYVIWCSLDNAPLLEDLLQDMMKIFSPNQQENTLPTSVEGLISELTIYFTKYRCLIILDNVESILQSGYKAGTYRKGYEEYKELFKQIIEGYHQSCLMLTTRENLAEVVYIEKEKSSVSYLQLSGLNIYELQQLLKATELTGEDQERQQLIKRYQGNPKALKIVSASIKELFGGEISEFLKLGTLVVGSISNLLEQQVCRLTDLERQLMYWLAINREPVKVSTLLEDFSPTISPARLLEALESLERRSLIEKNAGRFTQQHMVMEYMSEQLIEQVYQEIVTDSPNLLFSHALIKVQAKDYIQKNQIRVILEPLINRLSSSFKSKQELEHQLQRILLRLKAEYYTNSKYGYENIISLLGHMKVIYSVTFTLKQNNNFYN